MNIKAFTKDKNKFARFIALTIPAAASLFLNTISAYGQGNNYFGTTPGSPSSFNAPASSNSSGTDTTDDSNPNAVLPGLNDTSPNNAAMGGDFTGDEKRMQKKYKANMVSAKRLIEKGESMMASAGKDPNKAEYKKGKILKETGEKWLVQLKGSSPFPEQSNK